MANGYFGKLPFPMLIHHSKESLFLSLVITSWELQCQFFFASFKFFLSLHTLSGKLIFFANFSRSCSRGSRLWHLRPPMSQARMMKYMAFWIFDAPSEIIETTLLLLLNLSITSVSSFCNASAVWIPKNLAVQDFKKVFFAGFNKYLLYSKFLLFGNKNVKRQFR